MLDMESLKEYLRTKEEAIDLLLKNESTDYKTPEISLFNQFLLNDCKMHESLISNEKVLDYIQFFMKSASKSDVNEVRRMCHTLISRLDSEETLKLNSILENMNSEHKISTEQELLENRLFEMVENESSPEFDDVYKILIKISQEIENLSPQGFVNLGKCLEYFDLRTNPELLLPALEALRIIFDFNRNQIDFQKAVTDFIFSENVILALPKGVLVDSYAIILGLSLRECDVSGTKIDEMTDEMVDHFKPYSAFMKEIIKIFRCLNMVQKLKNESTEADLKIAFSALNNLKRMAKADANFRKIINFDYDILKSSVTSFYRIYAEESCPLFPLGWKVVSMIGLLCYELSEGLERKNSCTNIVAGIGYLLLFHEKWSPDYPTALIEDLLPNIDDIIGTTLNSIMEAKLPLNLTRLSGILKFIQLHPNQDLVNFYTDRICSHHISYDPSHINHYYTIECFKLTDKRNVYLNSFLTFLAIYTQNPKKSELKYLKEFYKFIEESKYLSKTDSIIISKILKKK